MKGIITFFLTFIILSTTAQSDSAPLRQSVDSIASAQNVDSANRDSVPTISSAQKAMTWKEDTIFFNVFRGALIPQQKEKPIMQIAAERPVDDKDDLFFVLLGIFAFFGLIRFFFPRYIQNTFGLLFQSSFRQKQTRDQLIQDTLPSILVNLLFFATGGLFIAIALEVLKKSPFDFWQTFLYSSIALAVIYVVKYLFLLFFGWVFNVRESASVYVFIVFLINKIIAVLLLPLLLIIAFSGTVAANIVITAAACIVILLFIYRYIAALSGVRGDLRVNALHFFIYLCAVEVAPLLVIFKLLANQIGSSI